MSPGSGLRVLAAMAMAVIVLAPRPQALEANLSMQGVDDAIVFARMAQRDTRQAFHDRYVRTVSDAVGGDATTSRRSDLSASRKRASSARRMCTK